MFNEEVGDPGTCTDVEAPLESRATDCTASAVPPAQAPTSSASTAELMFAAALSVVILFAVA